MVENEELYVKLTKEYLSKMTNNDRKEETKDSLMYAYGLI